MSERERDRRSVGLSVRLVVSPCSCFRLPIAIALLFLLLLAFVESSNGTMDFVKRANPHSNTNAANRLNTALAHSLAKKFFTLSVSNRPPPSLSLRPCSLFSSKQAHTVLLLSLFCYYGNPIYRFYPRLPHRRQLSGCL